ncbi:hypothetical protein L1987_64699 [Smallanthus sonchifolius]|uniref:Uncharacterized protein n=1 Tax=Smallanthus sonchifolius TaxID=185202 RepID=A0ACB9BSC8_9ASTR|nr:hypothetical protein L1987_64699 [Smallanthus sonchifolius]
MFIARIQSGEKRFSSVWVRWRSFGVGLMEGGLVWVGWRRFDRVLDEYDNDGDRKGGPVEEDMGGPNKGGLLVGEDIKEGGVGDF